MGNYKPLKPDQVAELITRYRDGESILSLAKYFNKTHPSILRYLKNAGIETRAQGHHRLKLTETQSLGLLEEYSSGVTIPELVRKFNIGYASIVRRLKLANLYTETPVKKSILTRELRNKIRTARREYSKTKPSKCESCSRVADLHGHHDDYTKLLSVRWLCRVCHKQWHKHNYAEGLK